MSINMVPALELEKQRYIDKKNNACNNIAGCEGAYESLMAFKTVVSQSQDDFYTINSAKSNALSEIENIKGNCITAQKYYDGMQRIFSRTGVNIIGGVYNTLLTSISKKLRKYADSVNGYEDDIAAYDRKIEELDKQIEEAKKADLLTNTPLEGGE